MKITTENHVKALVKNWFDSRKGYHYAPIQNGLGVHGVPDRLGVIPVTITPDMVGKTVGLFVSVEAKKPGRRNEKDRGMSKHQVLFQEGVIKAGGLSVCCDGQDDLDVLDAWIAVLTGQPL